MDITICISIWVIISILFGRYEADLFHNDITLSVKYKHIHLLLTVIRIIVAFILLKIFDLSFIFLIPMSLMFPYFHDGMYYIRRNNLNPKIYIERWRAASSTTTAIFSFKYTDRFYFLILSIFALLWIITKQML